MSLTRRSLLKGAAVAGGAAAAAAVATPAEARQPLLRHDSDVGMLYDSTLCVGCRACVVKCKEANGLPPDAAPLQGAVYDAPVALNGTTKNVITVKEAKGGASDWSFMKVQCMHCADPSCVSVCMAGALHKDPGGIVAYEKLACVGCRYCQVACPFDIPKFNWDKAVPVIVKCELCRHRGDAKKTGALKVANPACCEVCPRDAVVYGTCGELKELAHKRMKASPERYNPKLYGDTDAGGTAVMYLTAKGVSFDDLGLPKLTEEALPIMSERIQHGIYKWFAGPVALYGLLAWSVWRSKKHQDAHSAQGHAERQAQHHPHHQDHHGEEK